MFSFYLENKEIEINSNSNIFIFQVKNPDFIVQKIFTSLEIKKEISLGVNRYDKFLYFSHLTKLSDFISLNKNNVLYRNIIKNVDLNDFFKFENLNNFISKINGDFGLEVVSINDCEVKSLFDFLELQNNIYFDFSLMIKTLNYLKNGSKQFVILNELENFSIEEIISLSKYYDFLIFTTNIRKIIHQPKYLELCVLFNYEKNDFIMLDNKQIIYDYLEQKMNIEINDTVFANYLSGSNDQKSSSISFFIENIF